MREDNGLDLLRVEPGCGQALSEEAGFRTSDLSAACPGVDQDQAATRPDRERGERNRYECVAEAGRLQRGLGLLDVGTFDQAFVMSLLPDAVIERETLDVAHL